MNIGKLLRSYREVNRKSIRDLSKEIGLTIATLSRVENGKPVDLRITLVLINWLFGGQQIKVSPNTADNSIKAEIRAISNIIEISENNKTVTVNYAQLKHRLRELSAI
jgi:transcriptional regulator with XRE-family HTH domain